MIEATISVQTLGIGIAAFIASLAAVFLFMNAYKENVARSFAYAMVGTAFWGWFGFASAIAADSLNMELARQLRVISILGNVLLAFLFVRFAYIYKNEKIALTKGEHIVYDVYIFGAVAFALFLLWDAFLGSALVMGAFAPGAATPIRGPLYDTFVIYYCSCIVVIFLTMMKRVRSEVGSARRGHIILTVAMTAGASFGIAGFAAWYGIYSPAFTALRALAIPTLSFSAFYAMSTHNIFNFRVAAANIFVFAIWSFLFFRILLNPSAEDAFLDICLLVALIILGVMLIRSFNKELDSRGLVERIERERAIEQSKSEFISIAAHQLRTPLAGIRWTFSILEAAASGLTDEQRALVAKGSERTLDVVERVNEMLRAARLTDDSFVITRTPQDIKPIVKDAVALFKDAAAARGLTLDSTIPRTALKASVDRDKFAIVVQNLIDNAIKYTKTGSVTVTANIEGEQIVICVQDTGIGISDDDRKHLFEKFYRSDTATKMFTDGSGLGLFIVKKIVDTHDGTIEADSKPGTGTTFIVRIPVAKNG